MDAGGIDETDGETGEGPNEPMVQETMKTQTFHVANIQNLLTKTETGERGMFMKKIEKMDYLRERCGEEEPLFLVVGDPLLLPRFQINVKVCILVFY